MLNKVFESTGAAGRLLRYAVAAIGPVSSAAAQFILSMVLVKVLPPLGFGSFAFLLVASQFSWGLWSALFCAPLPILLHQGEPETRPIYLRSLFSANILAAGIGGIIFFCLSCAIHVPLAASLAFGAYGSIALLRWFARAYAYATGVPLRTMASDLIYSTTLVAGVVVAALQRSASLEIAYCALLLSAILGLLTFGRSYFIEQFFRFSPAAVLNYAAIWRRHAGWSLLGVVTTEATANVHVYIVTFFWGPTAFAPIAASALLIRPVGVAMNALTEFERAQMSRLIGANQIGGVASSVMYFRLVLIAAWLCTALLVGCLLLFAPRAVFSNRYPLAFVDIGALLWMAVAGVRLLRTPESALLQAAGAFRPLAYASVISSGISVLSVIILLNTLGTLWSIGGIFAGETMYAIWIWRQARRWRRLSTS